MIKSILGGILGVIFVVLSVLIVIHSPQPDIYIATVPQTFSSALWEFRSLDVFLQLLVILAGTFGILTLVRRAQQ